MKAYIIIPIILVTAFGVYERDYRTEVRQEQALQIKLEAARLTRETKERAEYQKEAMAEAREARERKRLEAKVKQDRNKALENAWAELTRSYEEAVLERDKKAELSFDLAVRLRDEQDLRRRMEDRLEHAKEEMAFLENLLPRSEENLNRQLAFLESIDKAILARTVNNSKEGIK